MKKGIKIGINDINGTPIKNGDLVSVEFVNHKGNEKEYVDDKFEGEIVYNPFNCMFMIDKVGSNSESWNDCYVINHRSMRIKIHN
jgi:hypothetical protein